MVYQMGNSSFHHYMPKLLEEISGVLVLHDFYLSGFYNYMGTIVEGTFELELFYSH